MSSADKQTLYRDDTLTEKRRLDLLGRLAADAHPLAILGDLEQSSLAVLFISNMAARVIREGLVDPRRRKNESSALAKVKIAARTPDNSCFVYLIESFRFENLGSADAVVPVQRKRLNAGEIEIHTHVYTRSEYLGQVDIADLIAAVEGPTWVCPPPQPASIAIRIFGILSVYDNHLARLQFYIHDLSVNLESWNNYGLKTLGMPVTLPDAY